MKQAYDSKMRSDLLDAVPQNWCDPLLTGSKGIGGPPYNCQDIEQLMNGIRAELTKRIAKYERAKP